jgi:prophage antirepressor-like protein
MPNIIPFNYEGESVRVSLDETGKPWFNAKDVCGILGYSNPRKAVADHVDPDDVTKRDAIDEIGRTQRTNHVNESGLYALIFGSHLEAARRFKHWVTREVLPAIRRTGTHAAPGSIGALPAPIQDRVTAILLIGEAIAKVPGVKHGIAMAATLTCIQQNTGLSVETLRRALPACDEPLATVNPTKLGELAGLSAKSVNLRLAALGFQHRNDRDEWELTEDGKAWGEALPYSRNGHSGYQILWKPEVADLLREAA